MRCQRHCMAVSDVRIARGGARCWGTRRARQARRTNTFTRRCSLRGKYVVRDAKGQMISVRYDELAPMLLNEVQQQAAEIRELKAAVHALEAGQHN